MAVHSLWKNESLEPHNLKSRRPYWRNFEKRFIFCLIWLPSSRIFVTGWVTHNKLVPQCCYTRRHFRRTNFHTYKPLNGNLKRICKVPICELNNPGNTHLIPFDISIFSSPLKDIEGCSFHPELTREICKGRSLVRFICRNTHRRWL